MTPTEITTIGSSTINSFKYEMIRQFSLFADKVCIELRESNDIRHIEYQKQRLELASAFIEIMTDYLRETVDTDDNFFTVSEFYQIVRKLNKIFNTYYWLDLTGIE